MVWPSITVELVVKMKGSHTSLTSMRTARGQVLYSEYPSKNCIWLGKGFRNTGLLQEILDRVGNGEQNMKDVHMLLYHNMRFPAAQTEFDVHYGNECYNISNWIDL